MDLSELAVNVRALFFPETNFHSFQIRFIPQMKNLKTNSRRFGGDSRFPSFFANNLRYVSLEFIGENGAQNMDFEGFSGV